MKKILIWGVGTALVITALILCFGPAEPATAPDIKLTLLASTNLGPIPLPLTNLAPIPGSFGGIMTKDLEYEVVNSSGRSVQLIGRGFNVVWIGNEFPSPNTTVLVGASPNVLRAGEKRKVLLRSTQGQASGSRFRADCIVTSGTQNWVDQLLAQPWLAKYLPKRQVKSFPHNYTFGSAWTEE